ncbi:MAG TPA: low affinity iron permease family protein [Isosphaeraceae bacterium]|jgi:low affinity Fe/Cu permease|nr:low affinity iron permease family protein [Isosphaeraceae bacterium]
MASNFRPERNGLAAPPTPPRHDLFNRVASWTIRATGGRWGFLTALAAVIIWAATGPYFHFSDTWQMVVNTGTTIVTFLMVFLIQNAQNRESKAVHLKLDELIYAVKSARNELIDVENLTEEQLDQLAERYRAVAAKHHGRLRDRLEGVADEVGQVEGKVEKVEGKVEEVEDEVRRIGKPTR